MTIQFDPNVANKIKAGLQTGEAVELPFPVVYLWVINGLPSYKQQAASAPALYYGGWACKQEQALEVAQASGLAIPDDWVESAIALKDGEYEGYTTRSIMVAPFGKRESWLLDGRRHAQYVEGGRRHVQYLAYMAELRDKTLIPWGPVVFSGKGYQARYLNDAIIAWEKATAQARMKLAPGIPAAFFWMALGTFGKERQAVSVGKPGAQSPITPITTYIPADGISPEVLERRYIGSEIAAIMADKAEEATEWLNAWKKPAETETGNGGPEDDFFVGTPPDSMDIPF
jgi:hypothetical protein